jgi:hypothetical protein
MPLFISSSNVSQRHNLKLVRLCVADESRTHVQIGVGKCPKKWTSRVALMQHWDAHISKLSRIFAGSWLCSSVGCVMWSCQLQYGCLEHKISWSQRLLTEWLRMEYSILYIDRMSCLQRNRVGWLGILYGTTYVQFSNSSDLTCSLSCILITVYTSIHCHALLS